MIWHEQKCCNILKWLGTFCHSHFHKRTCMMRRAFCQTNLLAWSELWFFNTLNSSVHEHRIVFLIYFNHLHFFECYLNILGMNNSEFLFNLYQVLYQCSVIANWIFLKDMYLNLEVYLLAIVPIWKYHFTIYQKIWFINIELKIFVHISFIDSMHYIGLIVKVICM